jgi:hypothetical protein
MYFLAFADQIGASPELDGLTPGVSSVAAHLPHFVSEQKHQRFKGNQGFSGDNFPLAGAAPSSTAVRLHCSPQESTSFYKLGSFRRRRLPSTLDRPAHPQPSTPKHSTALGRLGRPWDGFGTAQKS